MQIVIAAVKARGGEIKVPKDELNFVKEGDSLQLIHKERTGEYIIKVTSTNGQSGLILPSKYILGGNQKPQRV
jgi:hypothetical protein